MKACPPMIVLSDRKVFRPRIGPQASLESPMVAFHPVVCVPLGVVKRPPQSSSMTHVTHILQKLGLRERASKPSCWPTRSDSRRHRTAEKHTVGLSGASELPVPPTPGQGSGETPPDELVARPDTVNAALTTLIAGLSSPRTTRVGSEVRINAVDGPWPRPGQCI